MRSERCLATASAVVFRVSERSSAALVVERGLLGRLLVFVIIVGEEEDELETTALLAIISVASVAFSARTFACSTAVTVAFSKDKSWPVIAEVELRSFVLIPWRNGSVEAEIREVALRIGDAILSLASRMESTVEA